MEAVLRAGRGGATWAHEHSFWFSLDFREILGWTLGLCGPLHL